MSYEIGKIVFKTKSDITHKCREILHSTTDNESVKEECIEFLIGLFKFHDEWERKSSGGIVNIVTSTTPKGSRCFMLLKKNGSKIDISFTKCVKNIESVQTKHSLPEKLLKYKKAARTAVDGQIKLFRDNNLNKTSTCPILDTKLNKENYSIDHTPPLTFDQLLFNFTKSQTIDPLKVDTISLDGFTLKFKDKAITLQWEQYHKQHAKLSLISKQANLQQSKPRLDWKSILD